MTDDGVYPNQHTAMAFDRFQLSDRRITKSNSYSAYVLDVLALHLPTCLEIEHPL
jgi:hypothetical protein